MKYNLTKESVDKINTLIHKDYHFISGRMPEKILGEFTNDPRKKILDKTKLMGLKSLVNNGLVTVNGSVYTITDYGKYLIIAKKFNICFLSLCALSEIYVMQSNFSNPKNGSYPVIRFSEKLDVIYSQTSLRMKFVFLKMEGYVCRKSSKKVYIPFQMYLKIKKYDKILRQLQKWFVETCDKIDDIVDADQNIKVNIKKNTF